MPSSVWPSQLASVAVDALARAREHLGVRRTALFWLDADDAHLACVATVSDAGPEGWVGQTLAAGLGMAGRAVATGRPVWTPDLPADDRVPIAPWLRERLEVEGLRVVAAAPVRIQGRVRGALGCLDGPGRTYDAQGLSRLERLADDVAASLARAEHLPGAHEGDPTPS
jgi:hypothetical protein